jgi:hypothetical protein
VALTLALRSGLTDPRAFKKLVTACPKGMVWRETSPRAAEKAPRARAPYIVYMYLAHIKGKEKEHTLAKSQIA